jgi:prevent-host-death family protein
MKVTTTEFRRNLFQLMDRATLGELVEVVHKGVVVRLAPAEKPTKLSRLVPRDTIVGSFEDFERAQKELDDEMRSSWEAKWEHKL